MCDQDGVLQGKPMHRDDCHYIIAVSSQIQIRISAISFLSSQLLPISNDCQFCCRYDCHHHQRSVGLLMWRSPSAKISGPKGLLCCYLKSHLQQRAHEENANGYFCICCILFVLDLEEHVYTNTQIQMIKYKHILMDNMNGYLYICCTHLILRCKTVAFETESGKQAKKYNFTQIAISLSLAA